MKIVSVVGARPQFIKMAPVSRVLREYFTEVVVHTGQHYDDSMSAVFFRDLNVAPPDYNLKVGSGKHGEQTGEMLMRIEQVLFQEKPDWLLVYGDTNSTIAGALAAAKLQIPVAHVEAGLRSFNRAMPEEINRVLTDHVSDLLFCPTGVAVANLAQEGITRGVHQVGDVMYDAVLQHAPVAAQSSQILPRLAVAPHAYLLATIHRPYNTDTRDVLAGILDTFAAAKETVVFPVHPRTRKMIETWHLDVGANLRLIDPVSYLDMLMLEQNARLILTDSGGVQKEAYFCGVPCITLRSETEWVETVQAGWNVIVGNDGTKILDAIHRMKAPLGSPRLYGDGTASQKIAEILKNDSPNR